MTPRQSQHWLKDTEKRVVLQVLSHAAEAAGDEAACDLLGEAVAEGLGSEEGRDRLLAKLLPASELSALVRLRDDLREIRDEIIKLETTIRQSPAFKKQKDEAAE